jgi:hypothetical protein
MANINDSLTDFESQSVYFDTSIHRSHGSDGGMEFQDVDELLPSINNDLIPRRSQHPMLKNVFPSGFGAHSHRRVNKKLKEDEMDAFDLSQSIESLNIEKKAGKLPPDFSFTQWTRGLDDVNSPDEKNKDGYAHVAGRFQRYNKRFGGTQSSLSKINPIREFELKLDPKHLRRTVSVMMESSNDDIDALVDALDMELGEIMGSIHHEENVADTLSLASMYSQPRMSTPKVNQLEIPQTLHTTLHVEMINLQDYLDSALHQSDVNPDANGTNLTNTNRPIYFTVPVKINLIQFRRRMVEEIRQVDDMSLAKSSNILVSCYDIKQQYWKDIFKGFLWEQVKLGARTGDGVIRCGYTVMEESMMGEIIAMNSDSPSRAVSRGMVAGSPSVRTGNVVIDSSKLDEMYDFIKLESPHLQKKKVTKPSLRLARRGFVLPSTTMLKSDKKSKITANLKQKSGKLLIENKDKMDYMAKSLENRLYRTRW